MNETIPNILGRFVERVNRVREILDRHAGPITSIFQDLKEIVPSSIDGQFLDEVAQLIVFSRSFSLDEDFLPPVQVRKPFQELMEEMEKLIPPAGENPAIDVHSIDYEQFLGAWRGIKRKKRGVFYTPKPVVKFIVRGLDEILKRSFGFPEGLASPLVKVIDPACGTGNFLVDAVRLVLSERELGEREFREHFLGQDLMLVPCCFATWRVRGIARQAGLDPDEIDGIIHLGDSLAGIDALVDGDDIPVLLGNPPYAVGSRNKSPFIQRLMEAYKHGLGEKNIQPLSDDYIKFIRLAHHLVDVAGKGIVGFVVNNAFLYKIIHRRMRQSLLESFDEIIVINLHGNKNIGEKSPDGKPDDNIFNVRVGIALVFLIKHSGASRGEKHVKYLDLFGEGRRKLAFLEKETPLTINPCIVHPVSPNHLFIPVDRAADEEYLEFVPLNEFFTEGIIGIKTHRDKFIVDPNRASLKKKLQFLVSNVPDIEVKKRFFLKDPVDKIKDYRAKLKREGIDDSKIIKYHYRVHDRQFTYYHPAIITRDRSSVMRHLLLPTRNPAIVVTRLLSSQDFNHCFCTVEPGDIGLLSSKTSESAYFFPRFIMDKGKLVENICPSKLKKIFHQYGDPVLEPAQVFHYIYGILHVNDYRQRFREQLRFGFPRIPFPAKRDDFLRIANHGKKLMEVQTTPPEHLLAEVDERRFELPSLPVEVRGFYHDGIDKLFLNKDAPVHPVSSDTWNYSIGGYQVLKKWLFYRRGNLLGKEDIHVLLGIIVSIEKSRAIVSELNQDLDWKIFKD